MPGLKIQLGVCFSLFLNPKLSDEHTNLVEVSVHVRGLVEVGRHGVPRHGPRDEPDLFIRRGWPTLRLNWRRLAYDTSGRHAVLCRSRVRVACRDVTRSCRLDARTRVLVRVRACIGVLQHQGRGHVPLGLAETARASGYRS